VGHLSCVLSLNNFKKKFICNNIVRAILIPQSLKLVLTSTHRNNPILCVEVLFLILQNNFVFFILSIQTSVPEYLT